MNFLSTLHLWELAYRLLARQAEAQRSDQVTERSRTVARFCTVNHLAPLCVAQGGVHAVYPGQWQVPSPAVFLHVVLRAYPGRLCARNRNAAFLL